MTGGTVKNDPPDRPRRNFAGGWPQVQRPAAERGGGRWSPPDRMHAEAVKLMRSWMIMITSTAAVLDRLSMSKHVKTCLCLTLAKYLQITTSGDYHYSFIDHQRFSVALFVVVSEGMCKWLNTITVNYIYYVICLARLPSWTRFHAIPFFILFWRQWI